MLWRSGDVLLDKQMVPHRDLLASRFYREFLSNIGIARVCTGFVFDNSPGLRATSLAVFRSEYERPFDQRDVAWMKLLVPHVSRSLGVMQRLETARLQNVSLLASFDRLSFGVILLDHDLCALHTNKMAKEVLARRDGLQLDDHGRLVNIPFKSDSRPRLANWLNNSQRVSATSQTHFTERCRVLRKAGGSYDVQCSALYMQEWGDQSQQINYVVFITDPDALQLPDATRLQTLYGLTRTQSRVALAFARGATYKEVGQQLCISEETVRSHVKEIYPKTKVNRQADLVRLILALGKNRA